MTTKTYIGLIIRKFHNNQFSNDIMATRMISGLVCLLCLCYYFHVGYVISDFVLNAGANLAGASLFVVSLGLSADFILKMALWNGYVPRLQKLEVLPVKKKNVILARFVESLLSPYNLGLFLYILPFAVSTAYDDIVAAVLLPCAMLLAGIVNAAFSNIVKTSIYCRPAKSTIAVLSVIICLWLLVGFTYKANAEWGILSVSGCRFALTSVIFLFVAATTLFMA